MLTHFFRFLETVKIRTNSIRAQGLSQPSILLIDSTTEVDGIRRPGGLHRQSGEPCSQSQLRLCFSLT